MSYPTGYAERYVSEYNAVALARSLSLPAAAFKLNRFHTSGLIVNCPVYEVIAENSATPGTLQVSDGIAGQPRQCTLT
jgi:hypothetical protein